MRTAISVIVILYLTAASAEDIKQRTMDLRLLAFATIPVILLFAVGNEQLHLMPRLLGLIPGLLIVAMSFISGQEIGTGDGVVTAWLGAVIGMVSLMEVLMFASFGLFAVSAIYMLKGRRKIRLPFIPFLFGGFVICFVSSGLSGI